MYSNGGNADIDITMQVQSPEAEMGITPSILNYGSYIETLQIKILNSGALDLNWLVSNTTRPNWVSAITPENGSLSPGDSINVTITVDRTGLTDGNYSAQLQFISNGGNLNLSLNMQVGGTTAFRINCGGNSYTDGNSNEWSADQGIMVVSFYNHCPTDIFVFK